MHFVDTFSEMWLWIIGCSSILTPMQHGTRFCDYIASGFRWNHAVAAVLLVSASSASSLPHIATNSSGNDAVAAGVSSKYHSHGAWHSFVR